MLQLCSGGGYEELRRVQRAEGSPGQGQRGELGNRLPAAIAVAGDHHKASAGTTLPLVPR